MRKMNAALSIALLAGLSASAFGGGAVALSGSTRENFASPFREGRRFRYGREPVRKGGNPAGTKLARKAAQGKLTIVGIR
jgi:hypothetical protein